MKGTPLILEIKGNSLDDGPGIRTVIFFKGCPLSCLWCQNPESKKTVVEISYDEKECIGCGTCIEVCPRGALSRDNPFFINRDACTFCFDCVAQCPARALDRVGKEMTHQEIVDAVLRDKPFFDTSGGGVTLSGGEPTLFMGYVSELLKRFKNHGIHTLIETCGHFDGAAFESEILPFTDAIYYDLKLFDSEEHRRYCGVGNERIFSNFKRLWKVCDAGGPELLPRVPLIPDITDHESNLGGIAAFLSSLEVKEVKLLPYNPLWHEKTAKIGTVNPLLDKASMKRWQDRLKIEECADLFTQMNITVL